jgi:hypothetical protein
MNAREAGIAASALLLMASALLFHGAALAVAIIASLAPLAAAFHWPKVVQGLAEARQESDVPAFLRAVSAMDALPPDEALCRAATPSLQPLVRKAVALAESGVDISDALEAVNAPPLASKAFSAVAQSIRSGDWSTLRDLADEIAGRLDAKKSRAAQLAVEKHTLLLGSLAVPAIIGLLGKATSTLDFSGLAFGGPAAKAVSAASLLGTRIYLLEYSVLAAAAVAFAEGSPSKAFVYAPALLLLSQAVFLAAGA